MSYRHDRRRKLLRRRWTVRVVEQAHPEGPTVAEIEAGRPLVTR